MSLGKEDVDTSKMGSEGLDQHAQSVLYTTQHTSHTMGRETGGSDSDNSEVTCRVHLNTEDTSCVGCVVSQASHGQSSPSSGLEARQTSHEPRRGGREGHEGNRGQVSEVHNGHEVDAVCSDAGNLTSNTESDSTAYCGVGADCSNGGEVGSDCDHSVPGTAQDSGCNFCEAVLGERRENSDVNRQRVRGNRTEVSALSCTGNNCINTMDEDNRDSSLVESDTDMTHNGEDSGGSIAENGDDTDTTIDENGSNTNSDMVQDVSAVLAEGQHSPSGPLRRHHMARIQRRQNVSNIAPSPRRLSLPPSVLAQWRAVGRQWGVESDDDIARILMRNYEDVMAGRPPRPPPRPRCEECGEVLVPLPCAMCGPHQHSARLSHDPGHGRSAGEKGGFCGRCRD